MWDSYSKYSKCQNSTAHFTKAVLPYRMSCRYRTLNGSAYAIESHLIGLPLRELRTYRKYFKDVLKFIKLPVKKISLHGARGGAAFPAHQKGQKADQLALLGRWRYPDSVAHYLSNAKASTAALKLGNNIHRKLRQTESGFSNTSPAGA